MTYNKGESIYIPFSNNEAVLDWHGGPKLFKLKDSFFQWYNAKEDVEMIEYAPVVEAYWEDITEPGQITCGGNPYYACGRCGNHYGSFSIVPRANYCENCGAKMKLRGGE